jgi:hypothetical protein
MDCVVGGTYLAALGVTLSAAYLTATAAIPAGLHAGIELMMQEESREIAGTLVEKGQVDLLQTHGHLSYGDVLLADGTSLRIYDDMAVLEGKILPNSVMDGMNEGRRYSLHLRGTERIGWTVVDAQER